MRQLFFVLIAATGLVNGPATAAPPAMLYGKSIVVSWNETQTMRRVGQVNIFTKPGGMSVSIYVSTAGRVFNRIALISGQASGRSDQIAGQRDEEHRLPRVPIFTTHSMTMYSPRGSSAMRRISVDFDQGFQTCQARVVYAKETGRETSIAPSLINRELIEMLDVKVGAATCSIRNGNVFGEQ